jgi:hypothetical protein
MFATQLSGGGKDAPSLATSCRLRVWRGFCRTCSDVSDHHDERLVDEVVWRKDANGKSGHEQLIGMGLEMFDKRKLEQWRLCQRAWSFFIGRQACGELDFLGHFSDAAGGSPFFIMQETWIGILCTYIWTNLR